MSASVKHASHSEWSLRVDAEGRKTPNGAFVARPPVPYHGGNTVPRNGVDDVTALREAIANRKLLDHAVFIASQTPYTRSLLQFAYRENIGIEFDKDALDRRGAGALLDTNPRTGAVTLVLNSEVTPCKAGPALFRAGTLSHELTHAIRNKKKFFYKDGHTLRSAIITGDLQEGDARAGGVRAYADFMVGRPSDPSNRWKPPALKGALEDEPDSTQKVIMSALPILAKGNSAEFARLIAENHCQSDLSHYHATTISWFTDVGRGYRLAQDKDGMKEFMTFNYATADTVRDVMTIKGKPYLSDAPYSKNCGLCDTPRVRKAYAALQEEGNRYRAMGYNPQTQMQFRSETLVLQATPHADRQVLQTLLPIITRPQGMTATM